MRLWLVLRCTCLLLVPINNAEHFDDGSGAGKDHLGAANANTNAVAADATGETSPALLLTLRVFRMQRGGTIRSGTPMLVSLPVSVNLPDPVHFGTYIGKVLSQQDAPNSGKHTSASSSSSSSATTTTTTCEVRNRMGLIVGSDKVVDGEEVFLLPVGTQWMWPADNQKVTLSDLNYMQLVPLTNHPRVFLVEDFLSPTEVAMLVDAAVNGDVKLKPGRVGFVPSMSAR